MSAALWQPLAAFVIEYFSLCSGKELKRQTLLELVDFVNSAAGAKVFTEAVMPDVVQMVVSISDNHANSGSERYRCNVIFAHAHTCHRSPTIFSVPCQQ